MKSFDQQVADWARTKGADEVYEYGDPLNCALCQFLRDTGMARNPSVGPDDWSDGNYLQNTRHPIGKEMAKALSMRPHTFGALTDRLSHA
jgi:hypothetical protein